MSTLLLSPFHHHQFFQEKAPFNVISNIGALGTFRAVGYF